MPRGVSIRTRGLKTTIKTLRNLDKNIRGPIRKKMLSEVGKKTKGYAQYQISKISLTGGLLKSLHYKVTDTSALIFVDDSHRMSGYSWDRGMSPHFIHRNMISESGYSVGDWMDAKGFNPNRQYLLVGTGQIGRGIQFMDRAVDTIQKSMPSILKKYANMMR